jgi:PAS domain S-box-containing protein
MTFRNKLIGGFGAALCIVLMTGGLSYQRFLQEESDQKWVAHTQEVLEQLDAALAASIQLEDERGSLPRQAGGYQESVRRAADELQSHIARIKTLTADNPKQQAAQARLAELASTRISLLEKTGWQNESPTLTEETRRQLTGQIRNIFLEMRSEEERLLRMRLQQATARARQMQAILGAGYALSLLLFAVTVYSIFREIEKRKRTEERLLRAQEQYRLLFDSNPIPVWVFDTETLSILDVNATAVERYGYSREEFLRSKITDIRPQDDVPALMADMRSHQDPIQESGPWRHKKKGGELIDVQITSYPLTFGGKNARLVVATDITEQKKATDALRQN